MTFRPPVSDESVLMRWMALEMGRINDGVVAERKRLSELLRDATPSSVTRGGKEFVFNKSTIELLGKKLPVSLHSRLKLPVIFYFDSTVADSFLLTDAAALESLQELGELSDLRELIGGRLWVGRAIVYAIMLKYPGIIQIMVG
ncbi:MAG: DUF61 family protein [Methanoregulaceae archaeon]|nr:DUF61 family protein [Methanoregulaceae archaeon]